MPLNIIIGRSGSGKSKYIMDKVTALENKAKAVIIVPATRKIITEEEYLLYTKKNAMIDTEITSIERYINKNINLEKLYSNKTFFARFS